MFLGAIILPENYCEDNVTLPDDAKEYYREKGRLAAFHCLESLDCLDYCVIMAAWTNRTCRGFMMERAQQTCFGVLGIVTNGQLVGSTDPAYENLESIPTVPQTASTYCLAGKVILYMKKSQFS